MPREAVSRPPPPTAGQAHQTASKLPLPASPAAPWEPGPEAGKSVLHPKKMGLSLGAIPPTPVSPQCPSFCLRDHLTWQREGWGIGTYVHAHVSVPCIFLETRSTF